MIKNKYNCEPSHFLCQPSAIFPAYFSSLIGHDARIAPSSREKIHSET